MNTLGCKLGFTTVSAEVSYDGEKAKTAAPVTCLSDNKGPSNKVTWCGVWNNGAQGKLRFLSLGANGQMKLSGNVSGGVNAGAGGAGENLVRASA
jgi:hypothetical protein